MTRSIKTGALVLLSAGLAVLAGFSLMRSEPFRPAAAAEGGGGGADGSGAETSTYVGVEVCKPCHFKEYRTWKKIPMAEAFARIEAAPDKEKCYACHTTGFGEASGFTSVEQTPGLEGVQCESCHGAGSRHVELAKLKDETKTAEVKTSIHLVPQGAACAKCHNPHVPDKAAAAREPEKEKKTE